MEDLKQNIIEKFGSLSEFCRKTGIKRGSIDHQLKGGKKKTLQSRAVDRELRIAMKKFTPKKGPITDQDKDKLENLIIRDFSGNAKLFAELHGFDPTTVQQILNGRRKWKTDMVKGILKVAE